MNSSLVPPSMNTPVDWFRWVDTLSNGVYINGFLFGLMILIYYWVDGANSDKLTTSTIIVALLATLLRAVNLTSDMFLGIFWGLVAVALFNSVFKKD